MGLDIRRLHKTYGSGASETDALRGIDLEVDSGEFVAIIGTSGSGKTTLLNVVGGLDGDYKGDVSVDGVELGSLDDRGLAELRSRVFGFVFQRFNLLDHLTVAENVALPRFFRDDADETDPERLLGRVGLADRADDRPGQLSGGQRQRVAIARALYGNPRYLLCDEPTGNLDRETGRRIIELFQELNREDSRTVLVVTHEEHVARSARRIVRLEEGRIVSDQSHEPDAPERASIVETDGAVSQ